MTNPFAVSVANNHAKSNELFTKIKSLLDALDVTDDELLDAIADLETHVNNNINTINSTLTSLDNRITVLENA